MWRRSRFTRKNGTRRRERGTRTGSSRRADAPTHRRTAQRRADAAAQTRRTRSDVAREVGREARVGRRRELEQPVARIRGDVEPRDELAERVAIDRAPAREILELLVRVREAVATHHRL